MNLTKAGLDLIKEFEGCQLKAYLCPANVWTIGWGHTGDVKSGQVITQAKADSLLVTDMAIYVAGVNKLAGVPVNQNEFDALVSFAYNCGVEALASSTMLKLIHDRKFVQASLEFAKWNKGAGKVLAGLVRRREAERHLFMMPVPVVVKPVVKPKPTPVVKPKAPVVKPIISFPSDLPLSVGSKGVNVKRVQVFLGILADGSYGNGTKASVTAYQKMRGLSADGQVGKVTWSNMFK